MKQLTKMIGSLATKLVALLLTLGLAGGAWGDNVAKIGDTMYETVANAFNAANEGDTVTLLVDATATGLTQIYATKAKVVDLNGRTLTLTQTDLRFNDVTFRNGNIVVDSNVSSSTAIFYMFNDYTLTFDNVKLTATGLKGCYLIGLNGTADLNVINGSEITINNESGIKLTAVIAANGTDNKIVIENSKVTVNNLDSRVFFSGDYVIKGNSQITLTGITKEGFRVTPGKSLSIEDTAVVNISGALSDGGIHLLDSTASYTKAETATVNATLNAPFVAAIGDNNFLTLPAAVSAAAAGDTITLLTDITLDATVAISKKITLDLNGKGISAACEAFHITSEFTVKDSSDPSTGSIKTTGGKVALFVKSASGAIVIDGGAIEAAGHYAIYNWKAGSVAVNGGSVKATSANAIQNQDAGTVTVNGGTVESTAVAMNNVGAGTVKVVAGEVKSTGSHAIYNYGTGAKAYVEGGTVTAGSAYTINNAGANSYLEVSGGKVSSTSAAICNNSATSEVKITGGEVVSTSSYALYNYKAATAAISGGTLTSEGNYVVCNQTTGSITVTGGSFKRAGTAAIFTNKSTGIISVTGGYYSAAVTPDGGYRCIDNPDATPDPAAYPKKVVISSSTVTFQKDDGTAVATGSVEYGKTYDTVAALKTAVDAYVADAGNRIFKGWFVVDGGTVTETEYKLTDVITVTPDFTVRAKWVDAVAKYNGTNYETLQEAMDAAEAADPENIVIDLLADATLDITAWDGTKNPLSIGTANTKSITINGNDHKLTFNQKGSDWNNVATMNDAQTKLVLNNMTISNSGCNNGPWNRHDINFNCAVELNNVTSDKALAFKNAAALNNVTVADTGDIYGIWIRPTGQPVAIDGLTLTCGRGIKIDDQYAVETAADTTLTIKDATFNTTGEKSAILVKSSAKTTINASGTINISNVAADTTNLVWVDEDAASRYSDVTVTGATVIPEEGETHYVASVVSGGSVKGYYDTLAKAINAAEAGDTVAMHQAGTYTLPNLPKNITIEGKVEGVVFKHTTAGSIASVPNGATFRNVSFEFGNVNYHGFQHAGKIVMDDCSLDGRLTSYGDMDFTNCMFKQTTGDYNMWTYGYGGKVTYTGCTFKNTKGKFINVYKENGDQNTVILVDNCKFINNGEVSKAALNVKATNGNIPLNFDVIISNSKTEGPFPDASESSALMVYSGLLQVDDINASIDSNINVAEAPGTITFDEGGKIIGGTFDVVNEKLIGEGYVAVANANNAKLYDVVPGVVITYATTHGTAPEKKAVAFDANNQYTLTAADLPEMTVAGYSFKGWDKAVGDVITGPVTITALWNSVAQIGETKFESLQTAIDAAHDMTGDVTIELIADVSGYSVIHQKEDLNLTIDGKDKTIAGQIIIDGDGRANGTETLTIKNVKFEDDKTNFCAGTDAFILIPSTKDANKPYTTGKYNYAHNVTVTDCSFTSTSSSLDVVGYKSTSGATQYNMTMVNVTGSNLHSLAQLTATEGVTITGCKVTGTKNGINISGGGEVGTISGNTLTVQGYTISLKDSSSMAVTLSDNAFSGDEGIINSATGGGTITVEGGTYKGPLTSSATGGLVISGGHFSVEVLQAYCAENYMPKANLWLSETADTPHGVIAAAAKIGTTYYETIASALSAVNNNETITMLTDVSLTASDGPIAMNNGKTFTLDLNGHSIQRLANSNYVLDIASGTSVTIADAAGTGLIKGTPVASGNTKNPASLVRVKGSLTLNGGKLVSDYTCVKVDEDPGVGTFTMNGGTLEVIANDKGYTGLTFAVMNWATATINGGTVTGNIQSLSADANSVSKTSTTTINGGTFAPATIYILAFDSTQKPTVKVKDSITNLSVADSSAASLNWKIADVVDADGYKVYTLEAAVASITVGGVTTRYATLQKALDAAITASKTANAPVTVTLLCDVPNGTGLATFAKGRGEYPAASGANVVIDFNGKTYTVAGPAVGSSGTQNQALHFEAGATITLSNGTVKMTEDATALAGFDIFMQNYCALTIDGMTIDGTGIAVATYSDDKYKAYPEWYMTKKPQFNFNTAGSSVIRNSTIRIPGDIGVDDAAALTIKADVTIYANKIDTKLSDARYSAATGTLTVENGAKISSFASASALAETQALGGPDSETGLYTVVASKAAVYHTDENSFVTRIGYETFAAAKAASAAGDVIKLLDSVADAYTLAADETLKIAKNEKTITVNAPTGQFVVEAASTEYDLAVTTYSLDGAAAKIGTMFYHTLSEALAAANTAGTETTITILKNIEETMEVVDVTPHVTFTAENPVRVKVRETVENAQNDTRRRFYFRGGATFEQNVVWDAGDKTDNGQYEKPARGFITEFKGNTTINSETRFRMFRVVGKDVKATVSNTGRLICNSEVMICVYDGATLEVNGTGSTMEQEQIHGTIKIDNDSEEARTNTVILNNTYAYINWITVKAKDGTDNKVEDTLVFTAKNSRIVVHQNAVNFGDSENTVVTLDNTTFEQNSGKDIVLAAGQTLNLNNASYVSTTGTWTNNGKVVVSGITDANLPQTLVTATGSTPVPGTFEFAENAPYVTVVDGSAVKAIKFTVQEGTGLAVTDAAIQSAYNAAGGKVTEVRLELAESKKSADGKTRDISPKAVAYNGATAYADKAITLGSDALDLGEGGKVKVVIDVSAITQKDTDYVKVTHASDAPVDVQVDAGSSPRTVTVYVTHFSMFRTELDVASITRDGTTYYYTSLAGAIDVVQSGDTINMIANETDAVGISVASGKNFTVDFGRYTYTLCAPGAGSAGTETLGFQLLKDSTIVFKNGTINVAEGNLTYSGEGKPIKRIIQNYANLTLQDMSIDGTNVNGNNSVAEFCCGAVSISGATSVKAKDGVYAVTVDTWKNLYPAGTQVSIETTGEIDGICCFTEGTAAAYTKSSLTITGNSKVLKIVDESNGEVTLAPTGGWYATEPVLDGYAATDTTGDATYKWELGQAKAILTKADGTSRSYGTFAAAKAAADAAGDGCTIELLADVEVAEPVTVAKALTIKGAYTIKAAEGFAGNKVIDIAQTGDLTLDGVTVDADGKNTRVIYCNSGKLTLNGATVKGGNYSSCAGIYMTGASTFASTDSAITGNTATGEGVWADTADLWLGSEVKGTINSGSVGKMFVNANSYSKNNHVEVKGGTVQSLYLEADGANKSYLDVTGGTVATLKIAQDGLGTHAEVQTLSNVTSGSYSSASAVARIGAAADNKYYTTLAAAVAAAGAGDTVTLIKDLAAGTAATDPDLSLTAQVEIDKSLTLDLNGHDIYGKNSRAILVRQGEVTITGEGMIAAGGDSLNPGSSVIRVGDGFYAADPVYGKASLTINENVTIASDRCYGVTFFGKNSEIVVDVKGTVAITANPGTGSDPCAALSGNGTSGLAATKVIVSGTVTSQYTPAIYFPGNGALNVTAGEVTGTTGIGMKGGELTITGGMVKGTGAANIPTAGWQNGIHSSGAAIQIESNTGYAGGVKVTVGGGAVESVNAPAIYEYRANGDSSALASIAVTAGTVRGTSLTVEGAESGIIYLSDENIKAIPSSSTAYFSADSSEDVADGYMTVLLSEGEYAGWWAVKPDIAAATVTVPALTYSGAAQTPELIVKYGETVLVKDTDYVIEAEGGWANNKNAYTDSTFAAEDAPTVTLKGIGAYGGQNVKKFTIAKAKLTVKANDNEITYGDAPAPASDPVTYTTLLGGDTAADLAGTLAYAYAYAQFGDVGAAYTITPSGLSSDNYEISYETGTLKVVAKEVGLAWGETTAWTYDGAAHLPTVAVTGTVNDDAVTAVVGTEQTNVGSYTATVTGLAGEKAANYKLPVGVTQTFSIAAAKVTPPEAPAPVDYNGSVQTAVVAENALYTVKQPSNAKNAADYTVAVALNDKANYVWSDTNDAADKALTFKINQVALGIKANDQTYTYNGTAQGENSATYTDATKVTVTGLKGSDALTSVKLNGQETNVGEYAGKIVPGEAAIGEATANYDITYTAGKLTITKAAVKVVAAVNPGEVVKGNAPVYSYAFSPALLGTDTAQSAFGGEPTLAWTTDAYDPAQSAAGTYTFTYKYGDTSASNYEVTYQEASFTVVGTVASITKGDPAATTYYGTLADAITAAEAGDTVKLEDNIDITATQEIAKSLTLDLNGKDITATGARALWIKSGEVAITGTGTISANGERLDATSSVIRVGDSVANAPAAKLTVGENVTVATETSYGITAFGKNSAIELVVDGTVNVTSSGEADAAISGNGSSGLSAVTVTVNGTVTKSNNGAAIYFPSAGTLTVNDGATVTGPTAIYVKAGTLAVNGGSISAIGAKADYNFNNNGLNSTGDGIVIDNCGYPSGTPAVAIKGGKISSANAKPVASYAKDENFTPVADAIPAGSAAKFNKADAAGVPANYALADPDGDTWFTLMKDLSKAEISQIDGKSVEDGVTYVYDGNGHGTALTVVWSDGTSDGVTVDSSEYDITYSQANTPEGKENVYAGTVTVTATAKDGSTTYTGATSAAFEITKRPISIKIPTITEVYNGTTQKFSTNPTEEEDVSGVDIETVNETSFAEGDEELFTKVYSFTVEGKDVSGSPYSAVSGFNVGGETFMKDLALFNRNYSWDGKITTGGLVIEPREVTLKWTPDQATFVYNAAAQAPAATAGNVVEGESLTVTVEGAQTVVGENYTATATALVAGENTDVSNYKLPAEVTQTFAITPAKVELPTIASKKYTGAVQTAEVAASERYAVKANEGGKNVGEYDVVLGLTDAANYTWADETTADKTLKFAITPAEISVTVTGATETKSYTGSEIELTTFETAGLLTGHVLSGLTYSAKGTAVGPYTGVFAGAAVIKDGEDDVTQNYVVTTTAGTLTISAMSIADAVVTLGEALTYNGTKQTQGIASVKVGDLTLTAGTDYTVSGDEGAAATTYTMTLTGAGNYTGTATKEFTIAKKSITVTATVDPAKVAAGTQVTLGVEYEGFAAEEDKSVLTAQPTVTCEYPGKTAPGTYAVEASGAEAANYTFTYVPATLEVTGAVAKIGDVYYATLTDAMNAAGNGEEPTLIELVAPAEGTVIKGEGIATWAAAPKNVVIDFKGLTYEVTSPCVGSSGTQNQAAHLEKGSKVTFKNGTLTSATAAMLIQNYADLTLENFNADGTQIQGRYVASNNNGSLVVTGNSTIVAKDGGVAFDVCATSYYPNGVTVTFDENFTGTVTGIVEYDVWGTKPAENKATLAINSANGKFDVTWNIADALAEDAKANLNVNAGSFKEQVPADVCGPNLVPTTVADENGRYTVKPGYKVTFAKNDSEDSPAAQADGAEVTLETQTIAEGEKAKQPSELTRKGYTFDGWFAEGAAVAYDFDSEVTADVALAAKWKVNQYTITFAETGDSTIEAITADYGSAVTAPADPVKTGYTFKGWDKEIPATMPAEDVTITATWEINQYTITFAETGESTIAAITADYGTAVTAPADPVKTGYTFKGWDKEIPATMPAENVTIKATWEINKYRVTFKNDDGSTISSAEVEYGATPEAPAATKGATAQYTYTFKAWEPAVAAVTGEATYTATYDATVNKYTITFVDENGTTVLKTDEVEYGTMPTAPADPTKETDSANTYTFAGWTPAVAEVTGAATYKATYTSEGNVASVTIGDETSYYTSFAAALAAAQAAEGATIALLDNVTLDAMFDVTKSMTIDLNGKTLARNDGNSVVQVKDGATLTIDGTDAGSAVAGRINVGTASNNNGNVVLNGGAYTCAEGNTVLHVNGTCTDSDVTIKNAMIVSPDDNGIQLNGAGTHTIENSTIKGKTAVYVKAGEVTITGSALESTATAHSDYNYNGNGSNPTGDAIVVDSCAYPGGNPSVALGEGTTLKVAEGSRNAQVGYYEANTEKEGYKSGVVEALSNDLTVPEGYGWQETDTEGVYALAKVFTVTFNPDNGAEATEVEVFDGEKVSAPETAPVKEGYTFSAWLDEDGKAFDFANTAITADVTLKAQWLHNIVASMITVPEAAIYSGEAWTVTVKDGETELVKDTHYTVTYDDNVNAGIVTATVTGIAAGGYAGKATVEFEIEARPLVLRGGSDTVPYDGKEHDVKDYEIDTEVGMALVEADRDLLASVVTGYLASGTNVGSYPGDFAFDYNAEGFQTLVSNYALSTVSGMLTINRKEVNVAVGNAWKNYGEADPANWDGVAVTVTGLVGSDTVEYTVSRQQGENVGTYELRATGAREQGNYVVTFEPPGVFTIKAKTVTVTAVAASKTYGENDPALTATVEGLKEGDALTYTVKRAEGEDVTADGYAITVTGAETQGNYTVEYKGAKFTINPAAVTVKADDKTKEYGDADPEFTATVNGLKNGDEPSVITYGKPTCESGSDLGTYPITVTGAAAQGNYTVSYENGTLTVVKAVLSVTADDIEWIVGNTRPELTATATRSNGDVVTGKVTYSLLSQGAYVTEAGEYPIVFLSATATDSNYEVVTQGGTYTVIPSVAKIGNAAYYATLEDAFKAAAASGDTIELLADVEVAETIKVEKDVGLNLGGFEIAADGIATVFEVGKTGAFAIGGNGKVTGVANGQAFDGNALIMVDGGSLAIVDGTFTATGSGSDGMYGVYVLNGGTAVFGTAEGGPAITSHFAAIGTNNTTAPAHITVNGGTYTANAAPTNNEWWSYFCAPVYAAAAGDYTLNGGTFNGYYGISSRYANVAQNVTLGNVTINATSGTQVFVDEKTGSAGESARAVKSTSDALTVPEDFTWVETEEEGVYLLTRQYTVTFVDEDGETVLQSVKVAEGKTPEYTGETPAKEATAQYTYEFAGWTPEIAAVTGEATYKATYSETVNEYTITFLNEDGETVLQTGNVKYGETPAYTGETPTKAATDEFTYTFAGWDKEIVSVTGEATYTATFDATTNEYTIKFVNDDGTELQSGKVKYGATPAYTGETPTKAADAQYTYTFDKWDGEIVAVTGDATYTATYTSTVNEYVVKFVNEDGTVLQTGKVKYGETPEYKGDTPAKEADEEKTYTFAGWDKEIASVTGETTYTATYTDAANVAAVTAGGATKYYTSLAAAMADAKAAGTATVKMLADAEIAEGFVVDTAITLDMNGKTLTGNCIELFAVTSTGDLTITGNGTVNGPANGADFDGKSLITVDAGKLAIENGTFTATGNGSDGMYGVYVMNGGTAVFGTAEGAGPAITSHFAAIGTNNTTAPAHITVNGGTYKAKAAPTNNEWWSYFCAPVYAAAAGDFTLNGGTFNGYYGISSRYVNVDQDVKLGNVTIVATSGTQVFVDEKTGSAGLSDRVVLSSSNERTIPEGYTWVATENEDEWELKKLYTITFVNEKGETIKTADLAKDTTADKVAETVTKEDVTLPAGATGYTWTPAIEAVSSNATYTVSYVFGNGFVYPVGDGGVLIKTNWIQSNVNLDVSAAQPGSQEYAAAVTALSAKAANGIPYWQNYVLGLDPKQTQKLVIDSAAVDGSNYAILGEFKPVKAAGDDAWTLKTGEDYATKGYTVNANYRLVKKVAGKWEYASDEKIPVTTGENGTAPLFTVGMDGVAFQTLAIVIDVTVDAVTPAQGDDNP